MTDTGPAPQAPAPGTAAIEADGPAAAPGPPPRVADGVERRLDDRWVALQRTIGWIVAGAMSFAAFVMLGIAVLIFELPSWSLPLFALLWLGGSLALVWLGHRWPEIEHRHASYRVDADGIEIRRGVVWRRTISVPRSRVQHTDVSQGPLERGHGLGRLVIYTAGTSHARVDLPGLDHARAMLIRDHLLPREGGDAV